MERHRRKPGILVAIGMRGRDEHGDDDEGGGYGEGGGYDQAVEEMVEAGLGVRDRAAFARALKAFVRECVSEIQSEGDEDDTEQGRAGGMRY